MTACVFIAMLAPSAAPVPEFVVTSPAEKQAVGRVVHLADGTLDLDTGTVRDLVSLRQVGLLLPPYSRGPVLLTTTGDRVPGRLAGGTGQTLRFVPAFSAEPAVEWAVPVASVAVVWLTAPPAGTPADADRYPWLADNRRRDLLLYRNGDTARGTLDTFTADPPAVRFKPDGGDVRTVPLADLAAVAFNPALARTRKPKGPYGRVVLRDGTRLDVVGATADATTLRAKTLFGQQLEAPLAEVVALDVFRGKAVYLSDLKPARADHAGYLGPVWPWVADRSVRHEPLRLATAVGRQTFDRGLGTHPRTTLVYDLDGKYQRFETLVGLDPATGTRGRAVVRVLVDGREQALPELRALAAGTAVPVRVKVKGATSLTLEIDFGSTGSVQADVNWADARLVE